MFKILQNSSYVQTSNLKTSFKVEKRSKQNPSNPTNAEKLHKH